jgi:hypothetical protein
VWAVDAFCPTLRRVDRGRARLALVADLREGLRFEATVHPGDADVPLGRVADLDLDRVPDPQGGVRLLVTTDEIVALLERGYEVRLHRVVRAEPLSAELRIDEDAAIAWLEERVKDIPREEGER